MRYLFCWCVLLSTLPWLPSAWAAKPVAEEFSAPLQTTGATPARAGTRGSGQARAVKDDVTGEPALRATTAQDAIAAAIKQRAAGCRMIRFKTGFGWVATGAARYLTSENPAAIRRSRQEARFKAFSDARARLTGCLEALSPEARQKVTQHLEEEDAIRLALINLATNDQERRQQALKIVARGFVAYSVEDDPSDHTVYVNLVATPKTAIRLTRPTASAIEAVSLKEGLQQLLAEIGGGLTPPAGHRLIVVNATGELALVGHAVNPVGEHPDPTAQDKLRADAAKIATTRATEALVGLATGDDAAWINNLDETTRSEVRAAASGYDDSEPSARRLARIHELALSMTKDDPGLQKLREGRLPSEVTVKQVSGENTVAVAVIYTPVIKKREPEPPPQPTAPASSQPAAPVTDPVSAPVETR